MSVQVIKAKQREMAVPPISVVTTSSDYQKLCFNSIKRLTSRNRVRLYPFKIDKPADSAQAATLLVSRLEDISKESPVGAGISATTRRLIFLEDLPVAAIASRLLPLNIRNPKRIHIVVQRDQNKIEGLLYRLFSGMIEGHDSHSIVDAWIENQQLVLLSPQFARLEIPLEKLARFVGTVKTQVSDFEIDEDGRFLYWPHSDAHLGWTQFEQLIDPAKVISATKKTEQYNQRYGEAIRGFRESAGLKQSDIRGITDRQLRRVEHGQQTASKGVLEALARAHSLSLADYVEQLAKRTAKLN